MLFEMAGQAKEINGGTGITDSYDSWIVSVAGASLDEKRYCSNKSSCLRYHYSVEGLGCLRGEGDRLMIRNEVALIPNYIRPEPTRATSHISSNSPPTSELKS